MTNFLLSIFIKNHNDLKAPGVREKHGTVSSIVGIAVNIILATIKMLTGFISGSVAILADGINNLSDAGSSAVTFISFKIASKPADREHPFGHARIEYVASLIVSVLILHIGLDLLVDSGSAILGLSEIAEVYITALTFIILGISITMKLWLGAFYMHVSKKIDSSALKAAATDSFMDCISTTAVLVCSIIVRLTNITIIDSIVGLGVSLLIMLAGIKILIETKNSILGESPVESTVKGIEQIVSNYPEILGIHDMMVHNYGPNHFIASFHAEVDGKANIFNLHDAIDNAEKQIGNELGIQCTIHMDPIETDDDTVLELKKIALEAINKLQEQITMHDFRIVIGPTHTNLIFDIVLPFESKLSPKEATTKIEEAISGVNKSYFCVITVDRG